MSVISRQTLLAFAHCALKRNHVVTSLTTSKISHRRSSVGRDHSSSTILQSSENGVLTLTLNRPKQRNAMNLELLHELHNILSKLKECKEISTEKDIDSSIIKSNNNADDNHRQTSVRVVVVQANGSAFCSGHDLKEIEQHFSKMGTQKRHRNEEVFHLCSKVMKLWKEIPQPTISAVHGMATAAGCQLVASTDLVIASDKAQFSTPGVQIGLFCSTPAVPLLRCIPEKIALDMLYTGRVLTAHEAQMYGLVSRLVVTDMEDGQEKDIIDNAPAVLVRREAHAIAKTIASKSSAAISIGKQNVYKQISCSSIDEAYDIASGAMVDNLDYEDASIGITSFLQKEVPEWKHR